MKSLFAAGLVALFAAGPLAASTKEEEAAKYTKILKTSKDPAQKAVAAEEIGKLGQIKKSFAVEAVPYLIEALKDKDAKLRQAAAAALGKVDPDPEKAVPALVELFKADKELTVRIAAAQGLGSLGPDIPAEQKKAAMAALREAVKKDENKKLTQAARVALKTLAARKP